MTRYQYNSADLVRPVELTDRENFLLKQSKTFCIYPWIHIHAYPTGEAYPCCHAEMKPGVIGNCREQTLEQIWNGEPLQRLRDNMLNERPNAACTRCYEQEAAGFFSGRKSANKHHGHHVKKIESNPFELTYWDIRFSNLCNLRCRSCGHIFSSQWYQDQAQLAGPEWRKQNRPLNYAGRTETDMWEQLEPHLDYVEQIYFAGGEPLLMEEHYRILDELVRRQRFDVRLIYNTNFTHTDLKGRSVFDYWKKFRSVAVGASLDAMNNRAELIRKGTDWAQVEQNRRDMLKICPEVDFYISPTLSIMNALHLPQFHRAWVQQGLIRPQDLNVNILQDPAHYRIDIAPSDYKAHLHSVYLSHLEWLKIVDDPLGRATQGFESAVKFMMATDNTHLIDTFWRKTHELDNLRQESVLEVIPELKALL
jgi:radical SAM protein with 4Fe4S-binding SPASM domain